MADPVANTWPPAVLRDDRAKCGIERTTVCPRRQSSCRLILRFSCISTAFVSGLISACDDVVTETDHRLHGGAGAPGLGRRRTRERSAESSFRCIGRRRSGSRRPRRSEFGWSFCHCEFAGCDVQVRLVSRSCRSSRAIRHADRQPRCRTCHVGPRLRLLYASSSGLLSSSISTVCPPCHGTIVLA